MLFVQGYFFEGTNWPVFCCSALTGEGCNELLNEIEEKLPLGPQLYPSHMTCDHPEKFLMAEFIREQVLVNTREEVPHSVAVSIDKIEAAYKAAFIAPSFPIATVPTGIPLGI